MTTAIVKLNSLANTVWAGAQNHDLASIGWRCFALSFVSRIKIRRERLKLGAAGINAFVDRNDVQFLPVLTDFVFRFVSQISETSIRECNFFERSQKLRRNFFEFETFDAFLNFHDLLKLFEKPWIHARETIDLGDRPVVLKRIGDVGEALRIRARQFALHFIIGNVLET